MIICDYLPPLFGENGTGGTFIRCTFRPHVFPEISSVIQLKVVCDIDIVSCDELT